MSFNLLDRMQGVRDKFYSLGYKEATVREYVLLLQQAEKDGSVPVDHLTVCMGSIAMVLHESNKLEEACKWYDKVLQRPLSAEMRARYLQNLAAALAASHQYQLAVKVNGNALSYARQCGNAELLEKLQKNHLLFSDLCKRNPAEIEIACVKEKIPDLEKRIR